MTEDLDKLINEIESEVKIQYDNKDYYQVLDLLDILIAAEPTNPERYYKRAQVSVKVDCLLAASISLQKSLELFPNHDLALDALKLIQTRLGKRYTIEIVLTPCCANCSFISEWRLKPNC